MSKKNLKKKATLFDALEDIKESNYIFSTSELYIYPNDLALFQKRATFLEKNNSGVIFFPNFKSISSLENLLITELNLSKISDFERKFILNNLVPKLIKKLNFKTAVNNSNFYELAEMLGDALDRLQLSVVNTEHFLSDLFSEYEEFLKALNKYDSFYLRKILLKKLETGHKFETLKNVKNIYCFDMYRFSPFEEKFLIALAKQYNLNLTINVPFWVRDENIEHASGFNRLRSIKEFEKEVNTKLNLDFKVYFDNADPIIFTYENILTNFENENNLKLNNKIAIYKASTVYCETEAAVKKIKDLILQGKKPESIALIMPNLIYYENILLELSEKFKVAFYFRRGINLYSQKLVLSIFELLTLANSNWERSRFLRVLNSPYFNFANIDKEEIYLSTIEAGITDNRAGGGLEENLNKTSFKYKNEELLTVYNNLKKQLFLLKNANNWKDFFYFFEKLLLQLNWPSNLVESLETYKFEFRIANSFKNAYKIFKTQFLKNTFVPICSLENFILWFSKYLTQSYLKFDNNPENRVMALNYYDTHGCIFDEIFILGLNEKKFPNAEIKNQIWPENFLNEIKILNKGRSLWSNSAEKYREDEELFEANLKQAKEKINLFYSIYDAENNLIAPSALLEKVKKIWGNQIIEQEINWNDTVLKEDIYSEEEFLNYVICNYNILEGEFSEHFNNKDIKYLREKFLFLNESLEMKKSLTLEDGVIEKYLNKLDTYKDKDFFSVAQFLDYFDCPYCFYLKYILNIKKIGGEIEQWPKKSEGNILHNTLKMFFDNFIDEDIKNCFKHFDLLLNIFEENLRNEILNSAIGRNVYWESRTSSLRKNLKNWFYCFSKEQENNYIVQANEWIFSSDSRVNKPLKITGFKDEIFYLKGRIDRLDFSENNFRVIDYKLKYTKEYKFNIKNLNNLTVELYPIFIYMLAVKENYKTNVLGRLDFISTKPGEGLFVVLENTGCDFLETDKNLRFKMLENDEFNFLNQLLVIYNNLKKGFIAPNLFKKPDCTYCDYKLSCPHMVLK